MVCLEKIIKKQCGLSRELLTNPFPNNTLKKRLISSKSIDYKENYVIKDSGNGYIKIMYKDKGKLLKE